VVLTLADKEKLEAELNMLKTVKKAEVTRDIAEARAHGDLSENAEYDEAKNEEARVQGRIMQLEEMLERLNLENTYDTDTVGGWVGEMLQKVPEIGDTFELEGHRFEVAEMDGFRVTKVRLRKPQEADAEEPAENAAEEKQDG
jgi:CBS domain containing-hemolysin-like protein